MIRKLIAFVVLVPLAFLIVMVAVTNRHAVTLALNPLSGYPSLALTAPLFVVLLAALTTGVIVGGIATWLGQGRWRRAARRAEASARALRVENEALRRQIEAERAAAGRSIAYRPPPAA